MRPKTVLMSGEEEGSLSGEPATSHLLTRLSSCPTPGLCDLTLSSGLCMCAQQHPCPLAFASCCLSLSLSLTHPCFCRHPLLPGPPQMPAVLSVLNRTCLLHILLEEVCLFAFLSGIPTGLRVEAGYLVSIPKAVRSPVQASVSQGCFGMGRGDSARSLWAVFLFVGSCEVLLKDRA